MLKATAAGRIARDAELRKTQGGDTVCSFTVAVDIRNGREKETAWLRCSMWGKRGEGVAPYLVKGASVTVTGDLSFSEYEGKPQQNLNVDGVALQGGKQERQTDSFLATTRREPRGAQGGGGFGGGSPFPDDLDDSVPFASCDPALERRAR